MTAIHSMDAILQVQLDQRHEQFLYRQRLNVASGCGTVFQVKGAEGWGEPLNLGETLADVAIKLNCSVVIVVRL